MAEDSTKTEFTTPVQPARHLAVVSDSAVPLPEPGHRPARWGRLARPGERGMVSAEWAVGLIAAIAIAGVLVAVVTNGGVKDALLQFILMVIETFSRHMGSA